MIENQNPIEVAKAISDFGFTTVTAAFFLAITGAVMVALVRWIIKTINKTIERQSTMAEKILDEIKMLREGQGDISEGFMETSMVRISALFTLAMENSVNEVCRAIKRIKQENHIEDREATKAKIRRVTINIHDARNTLLEAFPFKGKPLSAYTNEAWIDQIAEVIEREVYDPKPNNGRTYSNVKLAYERISNEFSRNLRRR